MPYMFTSLFRMILTNYLYHPRQYISCLFRLSLISVYAGLFRLIINIIISILWHDINLFRLILYYKFVIFWHDFILLHVCRYGKHKHKERTKKKSIKTRIPLPLIQSIYR